MKKLALTVAAGLALAFSSAAHAGNVYEWVWNGTSPAQNPAGGTISSLRSTFDQNTDRFTWDVTYSDGVARNTNGYWLVVSGGPNPKSINSQLAIMYFDATNLAAPKVSIYRYNGANSSSSFQSPGDLLASTQGVGASDITASASQSGGSRTFRLSVDATAINAKYAPGASTVFPDWEGIQFGSEIGMWFHSIRNANFQYNGARLTGLTGTAGWLDGDHECTTIIPTPGAGALAIAGGLLATRRRRK